MFYNIALKQILETKLLLFLYSFQFHSFGMFPPFQVVHIDEYT